MEYYILGSGDATSQGYINNSSGAQYCVPLPGGFLNDYTTWEASYWYFAAPPLLKSQTDLPASETPSAQGWAAPYPSQNATVGLWERTLVPSPASVNAFAGRFVFEQSGGTAGDTCYVALSPTPKATGVTGGGWYVTQTGNWGWDYVGMWSQGVDWYQQNVSLPCDITLPQQMNVDGLSGPQPYTTNQLMYEITATKVYSEVQPQGGSVTFECEYYSNSTVGNRPCKN
ncbi:MAG: hypothetical protein KGL59_04150 [Acidobacteriota bacterium]|nr:hypothetical protein [Acidobacteriota bacterium]